MERDIARTLALGMILLVSVVPLVPSSNRVTADPSIIDNGDGTSDAVWNFTNPADYVFSATELVGSNVTLERQPTTWWNSTTQADFSGPDSETNIERNKWPGDVTMASTGGAGTLLTLQPGAAGEDAYLDKNNKVTNYGNSQTLIFDSINPDDRIILRFDLSTVPAGAVIDGAALSMYQSNGVGDAVTANLHQVTAQWTEAAVTWQDRLVGVSWGNNGGDYNARIFAHTDVGNAAGWRMWNITQLVDQWYRGVIANYGMIIIGTRPGQDSDKTFYSSDYGTAALRPRLDIWYRVIGANAEYISKVGGPTTTSVWKNISWNPSVKDLVSDEFNGASLDPNWTWVNTPTSYDVGVTTPGSLHVVSSTGTELGGGTFTGNVLTKRLVGDFTATMKYSVDLATSWQKSGLMVLVNGDTWYGISKTNAAGAMNWRVYATDQAATTIRVDVASGNPVPAWLRIQRVGNTFTSSTSADGITWTLRDTYTPPSQYPPSIRLGFFVSDGLSGAALAVDVDYIRIALGNDATVTVQTRIGDVVPVDASWSAWTAPYPTPGTSAMSGISKYIQYRLYFTVAYPGHMAAIGDVNVSWFRYAPAGTIETMDFAPGDLGAWGNFTVVQTLNGQTVDYSYSTDSGGSWTPVSPPADLTGVSTASGKIRFRASLSTTNTLISPAIMEIRLRYTHRLDHFYVTGPATAVAGVQFTINVTAKDALNTTIIGWTGAVALAACLLDGVTPGGGILGTTSVVITAGGTATLTTETYTKTETIRINATFGSAWGLSGPIAITPGPVSRIAVTPNNVTIIALDSQAFTAEAFDAYDNTVPGINFTWTFSGVTGSLNTTWGPNVNFTSSPPAANGTLQASFGAVNGTAQLHIVLGPPPTISISYPSPGAHVTGVVPIAYTNSSDVVLVEFYYDAGAGWTLIGSTVTPNGTFYWDTTGLDFVGGSLMAYATNFRTATNYTVVAPIEVDNTPPTITIGMVVDDQASTGTLTVSYATDPDVACVDFSYFDGAWHAAGSDFTIDGSYVWTPGVPINGVTLRAVATDEVNLTGATEKQGVGTYIVGPNPPSIAPIPDLYVRVGLMYTLNLTFYVSDPDTPLAALLIWDADPANVTANMGTYPSLDVTYGSVGTYLVTLWVSDGTDTAWTIVRIIASALSPPELVVPIPTAIFDEDTIALNALGTPATAFFNDPDLDPMTFTIHDAANISSRVNGDYTIDLWGPADWFGSEVLRLRATDPSGGFAEGAFLVIVRPVNDQPVLITSFPAVAFDEDTVATNVFLGNATLHFFDIDGDPLTISVLGGVNVNALVNPDGTVDLSATVNWCGTETLRVRATDPSGAFAEGSFLVTVRPVNDPPFVSTPLPNVVFNEDATALNVFGGPLSGNFSDIDGDTLTCTILGNSQVSYRINGDLTVDMWASANWSGTENLRARATDPNSSYVEAPFFVTVLPVNDPPVLVIPFQPVSFDEDTTVTNVFGGDAATHFFDVDGDPLTITILGGAQVFSRVNPGGTIDLWAPANWSGSETLRVRATDPNATFAEGPFLVTVLPVNDDPVLTTPFSQVAFDEDTVGQNVFGDNVTSHFFDIDGDLLTFSMVGGANVSSRINTDGSVDMWAPPNWFGSESLMVRATDSSGLFVDGPFLVTVRPVNDAPVLAPLSDMRIDDGAKVMIDLTPYVSDIDTPISQLTASTDNEHVTANGLELTVAFPGGQADTSFTVTVSDGNLTASRSVRISFIPVWWKSTYVLSIFPFGILLVVAMFAKRARWRPAKAFLVDERLRLLREFTLDPGCEVTYDEAVQAGALDAVEKPVKVQRYRAQTVKGDALAVVLLAYGPVSMEQVDFAREMLVNIQDKFEDNVKTRLDAARKAEMNVMETGRSLQSERETLHARSKAFAGAMDATTLTMSRIAKESAVVHAKAASFKETEARLTKEQAELKALRNELDERKSSLDSKAADLDAREARVGPMEESLRQIAQGLTREKDEFERNRETRTQWIATKEIDIEAKEQSLHEKQAAFKAEMQGQIEKTSTFAAREAALEAEREKMEKVQAELDARQETINRLAKETETKAATLREVDSLKAEEFRSWQATMESEQAILREQRVAFEKEAAERKDQWANRVSEVEQRETELTAYEAKIKADAEQVARSMEELARREADAEKAIRTANNAEMAAEAAKKAMSERAAELEQRERAMREEAGKLADEFARRSSALKAVEEEIAQKQAKIDRETSGQSQKLLDQEAELNRAAQALEAKNKEMSEREAALASMKSALEDREGRLARDETDLKMATKNFEERRVQLSQTAERNAEESERLRKEADALRHLLASKESELRAERERLERESGSLQDTLGEKAEELAAREKSLQVVEAEITERYKRLQDETSTWQATKEREAKQFEKAQVKLAEQQQLADRMIGEAKQRELVALDAEKAAKRQIDDLAAMQKAVEERQATAEQVEGDAGAQLGRLNEAAAMLAEREKNLEGMEAGMADRAKRLQTETLEWQATKEREAKQFEKAQIKLAEQQQLADRMIGEAKQRGLTALEAEKAAKRQIDDLSAMQKAIEERRAAAELAERDAAAQFAKMNEAAMKIGEREKKLEGMEAEMAERAKRLQVETLEWQATKEREAKQFEKGQVKLTEQTQYADRLIGEARQRELVALEAEKAAKRQIDDLAAMQKAIEERRAAAEMAERDAEEQLEKVNEAAKKLGERELKLQSTAAELQTREGEISKRIQDISKKEENLRSRRNSVEQDAMRFAKLSTELEEQRSALDVRSMALEKKQAELAQREQILTTEFQHVENQLEDVNGKEQELATREQFFATVQNEIAKRDAVLQKREAEWKRGLEEVTKARRVIEARDKEIDMIRTEAAKAQREAEGLRLNAEKEKQQAETMQQEVAKNMKFLQKKAFDILDKEEKLRLHEQRLTEREKGLDVQGFELQEKEHAVETQLRDLAAKAGQSEAEIARLKLQLAESEKKASSNAEVEEWKRDIENRVKILQKKAMEILDREEELRKREDRLKEIAEKFQIEV